MARRPNPPQPTAPAKLLQPRNRARDSIVSRLDLGISIRDRTIDTPADLEDARAAEEKWQEFNFELLRRMFTTEEYATAYRSAQWGGGGMVFMHRAKYLSEKIDDFQKDMRSQVAFLESLAERLDLIEEDASVLSLGGTSPTEATPRRRAAEASRRVFIVHGRDDEVKAVVARFLDKCGLEPIILHEQPDQGRTIIEKFEDTSDVAFAVVLLTPDDVGGLKSPSEQLSLQERPRQNVILELGFFVGALGRNRVVALKKGDLELPSDYAGVIYAPYDAGEAWKLRLARELKAAGLDVDMNAVLA